MEALHPNLRKLLVSDSNDEISPATDANSLLLYRQEYEKSKELLDSGYPKCKEAVADFQKMLEQMVNSLRDQDQDSVQESPITKFFSNSHKEYLLKKPCDLQQLFKEHPKFEFEHTVRRRVTSQKSGQVSSPSRKSNKSVSERRVTFQPKLQISSKPILRPLSYIDTSSKRESYLYESFQLMIFYLSNALFTMLPMLQQSIKFTMIRKGSF